MDIETSMANCLIRDYALAIIDKSRLDNDMSVLYDALYKLNAEHLILLKTIVRTRRKFPGAALEIELTLSEMDN